MSPSTLVVSMSAPRRISLSTSSRSVAAQAAKNTHPSVNWIRRDLCLGSHGSRKVSDSCHRFSCSARLNRAEVDRVSSDISSQKLCRVTHTFLQLSLMSRSHQHQIRKKAEKCHFCIWPSLVAPLTSCSNGRPEWSSGMSLLGSDSRRHRASIGRASGAMLKTITGNNSL